MLRRTAILVAAALLATMTAGAGALTIEAENARIRTAGAAAKGGWNLHSNGEVGDYVRISEEGTYTVALRAYGSPAAGVWPLATVSIDRTPGKPVSVGSREFRDYPFEVTIPRGVHTVAVAFLNDTVAGGEDRNLYLDRIEIRAAAGAAEPALASHDDWAAMGERREEAALKKAAEGVERHRKADATIRVVSGGKNVADAVVRAELARHEFLFGCNIYRFDRYKLPEQNATYKRRFRELFNAATTGFYWAAYERERGKPDYAYTDAVVAWAKEHGIRLKGHPLLWGHEAGVPRWSNGQPPADVQKARVTEICKRFARKIEFWEVVNEPSHCRGVEIDGPYRWARAADPTAHLILNDYHVMADGYPPFFALLEKALADGTPFDGLGIQAHEPRTMRFPLEGVQRILDRYAALGKAIHITEFTPTSAGAPITGSHRKGVWNETAQAEYAERFYRVVFGHPATVALVWWDLSDSGSWLKGGGLLRNDLSPKPAYDALWRLIHREWKTKADGRTDGTGAFAFRGIRGTYRVTVEFGGKTTAAEFVLAKDKPNQWTMRLE
ncbi:MAG TPA: endo-1,4-beta-xylanase [Phycisphaerae bacterium]|nr:endo-1,4-beta-xylanase [Phycisphaerae bacterium]